MKLNIGVFFGGRSCEHEISCISASQVLKAIDQDKYNVIPIYLSKNNDFYVGEALWDISNYCDLNKLCASLDAVNIVKEQQKVFLRKNKKSLFNKKDETIDVALLVMHGNSGEDGCLQGMLEIMGLPYTSSGVLGSAVAQDKIMQKYIFQAIGIPTVKGYALDIFEFENDPEPFFNKNEELHYPVIIKPSSLGSSIGITIAHNKEEFEEKVKEAGEFDFKLLVESFIENFKEINCSVLGNFKAADASILEEVYKNEVILDFKDKYLGNGKTKLKGAKTAPLKATATKNTGMVSANRNIPANINQQETKLIQEYALKAYRHLNCGGVVRIDFIYNQDNQEIYLNEVNNIPGSLAFYLWQHQGIDFTKLIDLMISKALDNYRYKERKTYSFDTDILANFKK